ncbi:heme A synthase [Bizionia gelidisalsuginis]|uniref:Heme A synthase n=1 Tax=Bizionia gelidisalsuginis TaxID=291188 RepID=A0ABY3MDM6_9FLAO|nr:COX15/CtaA family protein [Bizionia gelidisalsuginis]TYC17103.1 heme A synthase [Bizionia gelidisalsuginis]
MHKNFRTLVKTALILVYVVIIAGAVVRMTGSGMGCPDWPKCFGYYIPPTEASELEFKPNFEYKKGIVIIKDEALLVAKTKFSSGNALNSSNWEAYTKHDYAVYNPVHTWVEYINRLSGALSGIPILIFTVMSFWFWRKNSWIPILSVLILFSMGFQAWLGKTVVDSNLSPYKITIHMVMALVIVALNLYLIYITKTNKRPFKYNAFFYKLLVFSSVLTLIQIVLGTQVRQFVDEQIKALGYGTNALWLNDAPITFYIHRSFSILVLAVNFFLLYLNRKHHLKHNKLNGVIVLLILETITGIAMANFNFPFGSQSLHIVLASILFGFQFYLILEASKPKNKIETL